MWNTRTEGKKGTVKSACQNEGPSKIMKSSNQECVTVSSLQVTASHRITSLFHTLYSRWSYTCVCIFVTHNNALL